MTTLHNPRPYENLVKKAVDGVPDEVWVERCRAGPVELNGAVNLVIAAAMAKAVGAAIDFRTGNVGAARAGVRDLLQWLADFGFIDPGIVNAEAAMLMLERICGGRVSG